MAKMEIIFSYREIKELFPYALIATTRGSSVWNSIRRKRRWLAEFTEKERDEAEKIFRCAYNWTLIRGVPTEVRMSTWLFNLWMKIADFCMSL